MEWLRNELCITTDQSRMPVDAIHAFLTADSTWARGISRETVARSMQHSLCFALLDGAALAGFARVISDRATIAYLGDVFVVKSRRGKGLAKWLMECVMAHPDLQGMRRWILVTADAHGLYRQFEFTALQLPDRFMELHNPNAYAAPA